MSEIKKINSQVSQIILGCLENSSYGLVIFDSEKTPLYYNKKIKTFFVLDNDDSQAVVKKKILAPIQNELENFWKNSAPELIFEKALRKELILEVTLNKLLNAAATKIEAAVLVIKDITEIKKADLLKSEFIFLVAHELKTPLTAITGPATLLLTGAAGEINENQKTFLLLIKKNAERLNRLFNNLSDLACIESGRILLKKEKNNLFELIDNSLNELNILIKEKNIQIKKDLPLSLPEILIDGSKIEQVLINLITNAIKFSAENSTVTIKVEREAGRGSEQLVVSIIDEGVGIAEENLAKIFEKFYRVESTEKIEGTGLGLTIAKYIVEAHNGKIWVESQVGLGSKFIFSLPV